MFRSIVRSARRPIAWIVLCCLVVLLLAACGGTSDTSSTAPASSNASSSENGSSATNANTTGNNSSSTNANNANTTGNGNSSTNGSNANATNNGSSSTNANTEKMTVTIKEDKGVDGKYTYTFDPATITVKKGDTITIQNSSDELQTINQGDIEKAGINIASVPNNQSSTVTFNKVGTFTLKSEKGATITVTVQ